MKLEARREASWRVFGMKAWFDAYAPQTNQDIEDCCKRVLAGLRKCREHSKRNAVDFSCDKCQPTIALHTLKLQAMMLKIFRSDYRISLICEGSQTDSKADSRRPEE
jgi:hypothetical protein